MQANDRPHVLYRFFDGSDVLLYIGITNDLPARMAKHRQEKPWWSEIARIAVDHHPTRVLAVAAERRAIIAERPRWNVQHNEAVIRGFGAAAPAGFLRFWCDGCGVRLGVGVSGSVSIAVAEVRAAEREIAEWKKREERRAQRDDLWLHELLALPDPVPWRVRCDHCYVEEVTTYEIDIERMRTWSNLLHWTDHLSAKNWFEATDWMAFLRRTAEQNEPPSARGQRDRDRVADGSST